MTEKDKLPDSIKRELFYELARSMSVKEALKKFPWISENELKEVFKEAASFYKDKNNEEYMLFVDGAARGNPGLGGVGIILIDKDNKPLVRKGIFIGNVTNNIAEYLAIYNGLKEAKKFGVKRLIIYSDSELAVKQLKGIYRIKNEKLKKIFHAIQDIIKEFEIVEIESIPREKNSECDKIANIAIDNRKEVLLL